MARETKISWTDATFNPWIGCTKISPGCAHCYAERQMDQHWQRAKWGDNGTRVRTSVQNWNQVKRWDREAKEQGKRIKVFCASLADVFEDRPELLPWRKDLFDLIESTTSIDWLLLTKRADQIETLTAATGKPHVLRKCWVGISAEDQTQYDRRLPYLLRCPATARWVSVEPMLGDIFISDRRDQCADWYVVGGESGPQARDFDIHWGLTLLDQCRQVQVPYFFKQLGKSPVWSGKPFVVSGSWESPTGKGDVIDEWPQSLQVQEFPVP